MPRIPTFTSDKIVQPTLLSPAAAAGPARASAETGEALGRIGQTAGQFYADYREKELTAERTMKAL